MKDNHRLKMSNKKTWIKSRHFRAYRFFNRVLSSPLTKDYNAEVDKFDDINNRSFLILYNHQTPADQFLLGKAFPNIVYFVATEDIFSLGWKSRAMEYLINPIPIKKNGNDLKAVKICMKVAKEGGSIALAPEGNRTYSGTTEYIKPSVVKLIRALKLPVAFFVFEGGYNKQPRWSNDVNEGNMKVKLRKIVEFNEYKLLSDDELYNLVKENLYQDDRLLDNAKAKSVEYLERVIYVCPDCGFSSFESNGFNFRCKKCGLETNYTSDHSFDTNSFANHSFKNVKEWFDYQNNYINNLSMEDFEFAEDIDTKFIYSDDVSIYKVELYKNKKLLSNEGKIAINSSHIYLKINGDTTKYLIPEIENLAICGKNKLEIFVDKDNVFQIVGNERFNGVKYMNIFYRINHLLKGEENEFLGL